MSVFVIGWFWYLNLQGYVRFHTTCSEFYALLMDWMYSNSGILNKWGFILNISLN